MSAASTFFTGTVPEAISRSQVEKKPLIVFLKGSDSESEELEKAFLSEALKPVVHQSLVLLLEDDLEDAENVKYTNARLFRQLFPASQLPAVFMLGINGVALVTLKGLLTAEELLEQMTKGIADYQSQVVQKLPSSPQPEPTPQPQSRDTASRPSTSGRSSVQSAPVPAQHSPIRSTVQPAPAPVLAPTRLPDPAPKPQEKPVVKKVKKAKKQEAPKPPPVYTSTVIRFRLTNDESIEHEFPVDATLREICSYVDVHRTDGGVPYVLETMFPRQSLGASRYDETLKQLDLVPRTTVRLVPLKGGHASIGSSAEEDSEGGLLSTVYNGVGSVLGYLSSFVFSPPAENSAPPEGSSNQHQQDATVPETIPTQSEDNRVRRRSTWGGNVHSLDDKEETGRDPSANAFWNGNSTEFGGEENAHED